jgi:flagellar motility protein MotE (MotC chaperone)
VIRIRLLPIVVSATVVLLGLKVVDMAMRPRAQETVVIDAVTGQELDAIATGSSAGGGHGGAEEKPKEGEHGAAPAGGGGGVTPSKIDTKVSGDKPGEAKPVTGQELIGEIDILQKLGERRKKLEELERQLNMREDLLKASEDRIGRRIDEMKKIEDKIGDAAKSKEAAKKQELADLVKMYESMKPKDAARVFDKLEIGLLGDIARQMNPKKLGDVVSKMLPEQAERLTVELANRSQAATPPPAERELPKIQGRSG